MHYAHAVEVGVLGNENKAVRSRVLPDRAVLCTAQSGCCDVR